MLCIWKRDVSAENYPLHLNVSIARNVVSLIARPMMLGLDVRVEHQDPGPAHMSHYLTLDF